MTLPRSADPRRPRLIELAGPDGMFKAVASGNLAGTPVSVAAIVTRDVAELLRVRVFGGDGCWRLELCDGPTVYASTVVQRP